MEKELLPITVMAAKVIPIDKIEQNTGQIEGVPANPRFIKNEKYSSLVQSLAENPEMMSMRELLVFQNGDGRYVLIGGNMRYRALQELGYKEAPCKIITKASPEQLRAYIIKDNNGYGEWNWDMLTEDWDVDELKDWGMDTPSEWDVNADDYGETFNLPDGDKKPIQQMTFTFADKQAELIKECITKIPKVNFTFGNENKNGNALYEIVRQWDEQRK